MRTKRAPSPVSPGLERLHAIQAAEAAEHDRAVANYGPELLQAAYRDLRARSVHDPKNPEHRWIMSRRAALLRAGQKFTHYQHA